MKQDKKNKITQEGLDALKEELRYRTEVKKKELTKLLGEAREAGDLSENDGYTLTLEQIQANEYRIAELKELIRNSEVVNTKQTNSVQLGSTVTLEKGNTTIKYQIVSNIEGDPLNNKISVESPLGMALLNKKIGDIVKIDTPNGSVEYKIKDIN